MTDIARSRTMSSRAREHLPSINHFQPSLKIIMLQCYRIFPTKIDRLYAYQRKEDRSSIQEIEMSVPGIAHCGEPCRRSSFHLLSLIGPFV